MFLWISTPGEFFFYLSVVLSSSLVVVSAAISYSHDIKKAEDTARKNSLKILLVTGLVGIIVSLATSVGAHLQSNENGEVAALNDSLYKDLLKKSLDESQRIIDTSQTILSNSRTIIGEQNTASGMLLKQLYGINNMLDLSNQLQSKNELLMGLQKDLLGSQTGGDSYPFMYINNIDDSDMRYEILNPGNYPLYGISYTIDLMFQAARRSAVIFGSPGKVPLSKAPVFASRSLSGELPLASLLPLQSLSGKLHIGKNQTTYQFSIRYDISDMPAFVEEIHIRRSAFYGNDDHDDAQACCIKGFGIYKNTFYTFTDSDFYLPGEAPIKWDIPAPAIRQASWQYKSIHGDPDADWRANARKWYLSHH